MAAGSVGCAVEPAEGFNQHLFELTGELVVVFSDGFVYAAACYAGYQSIQCRDQCNHDQDYGDQDLDVGEADHSGMRGAQGISHG